MKRRTIKIEEKLTDEYVNRLMDKFTQLATKDDEKEITLLFGDTSEGGVMDSVRTFIFLIESSGVPVRTRNTGQIYSAASLLFLAGGKRDGTIGSRISFHPFTVNSNGIRIDYVNKDLAIYGREIKRQFILISKYIQRRVPLLSKKAIREFFNAPEYVYVEFDDAVKCGILTESVPVKV